MFLYPKRKMLSNRKLDDGTAQGGSHALLLSRAIARDVPGIFFDSHCGGRAIPHPPLPEDDDKSSCSQDDAMTHSLTDCNGSILPVRVVLEIRRKEAQMQVNLVLRELDD